MAQQDTLREYERSVSSLLPWKATTPRRARNAEYDLETSAVFTVGDFIAVRDEPASWFYLAKITTVTATVIIVHYYGCRSDDLKKAKFYPGWHLSTQDYIQLSPSKPDHHIRHTDGLDLSAIDTLLVAQHLGLLTAT